MTPETSTPVPPMVNITGEKIALGPHRRELLPDYQRWYNDFEATMPYLLQMRPRTLEAQERMFEGAAQHDPSSVDFTIYERSTWRPIGVTFLDNIDPIYQVAEHNIFIGEKDCWGKGYGTEATVLMLDYGFTLLGLHNIMLRVDAYNERALRAYRSAGFREFGRRREVRRRGNRRYDVVYMDCLASGSKTRYSPSYSQKGVSEEAVVSRAWDRASLPRAHARITSAATVSPSKVKENRS